MRKWDEIAAALVENDMDPDVAAEMAIDAAMARMESDNEPHDDPEAEGEEPSWAECIKREAEYDERFCR